MEFSSSAEARKLCYAEPVVKQRATMCSELLAQNFPPCDLWTTAQHVSQGVSPDTDSEALQSARELSVADTSVFQVLTHRPLLNQSVGKYVGPCGMVSKEKAYSGPLKSKATDISNETTLWGEGLRSAQGCISLRKAMAGVKRLGSHSPSLSSQQFRGATYSRCVTRGRCATRGVRDQGQAWWDWATASVRIPYFNLIHILRFCVKFNTLMHTRGKWHSEHP